MILLYILIAVSQLIYCAEISYNLPNLSVCAEWSLNGTTLITKLPFELTPGALFVDKNNTVYATDEIDYLLYKWYDGGSSPTEVILDDFYGQDTLFVLSNGDIYASFRYFTDVIRWESINNTFESVAQFCVHCNSIFITINDIMYCSIRKNHQILTKSIDPNSNIITVIAGVGIAGSEAHMLNDPYGIFVNTNFDLYVADSLNDRIQLFPLGEINGITIVGSANNISLKHPTGVVLDANNNMFIVDSLNHRIIAETPYGFRCIVACTGMGNSLDKLGQPASMTFDSFGNIYVTDRYNDRVQKFFLLENKCSKFDIQMLNYRVFHSR